jgi:hypothetical protein
MGRARKSRSKKTPAIRKLLLESLEQGMYDVDAIAVAGISQPTFYTWIQNDPDFAEAVAAARQEAKRVCVKTIINLAKDADQITTMNAPDAGVRLKAATWMLEHRYPDQYAERRIIATEGGNQCPLDRFFPDSAAAKAPEGPAEASTDGDILDDDPPSE